MSSVIQTLLHEALGDGARPTKFECFVSFPTVELFPAFQDVGTLTKTSQFPGKTHETIDLKFKGRTIPIKGQVKYDNTWSCSFYLTQDHALKKGFEDWIESMDEKHNMVEELSNAVAGAQSSSNITSMKIAQMDFHGSQETSVYTLYNVFPKSVSGIDVDYSSVGEVMEFTVEFSYSHYTVESEKVDGGSFVDDIKAKASSTIRNALASRFASVVSDAKALLFGSGVDKVISDPSKQISKLL